LSPLGGESSSPNPARSACVVLVGTRGAAWCQGLERYPPPGPPMPGDAAPSDGYVRTPGVLTRRDTEIRDYQGRRRRRSTR
jgi:hypothetical protein